MDAKLVTHAQGVATHEQNGVSRMELTKAQELIRTLKEVKTKSEITYPRIMDRLEQNGKFVSLSTLRRVFADHSEMNASSFSYENTLLPIAEALLDTEDIPMPYDDSPYAKEIDAFKMIIRTQEEEIARLHEFKDHLENRIIFLIDQIAKKDTRMDQKDEIIKRFMDKCL